LQIAAFASGQNWQSDEVMQATLKFATVDRFSEGSAEGFLIPFTLHVEGEYPRSLHVRAVRRTLRGALEIEFPPEQATPGNVDTLRAVARDYLSVAAAASETGGWPRHHFRLVREYPIDL
jgi:hypothetical protein